MKEFEEFGICELDYLHEVRRALQGRASDLDLRVDSLANLYAIHRDSRQYDWVVDVWREYACERMNVYELLDSVCDEISALEDESEFGGCE